MSPRLLASSCDVRAVFLAHGCMRQGLVDLIPAANATLSPNTWPFRGQWEQFALAGVFLLQHSENPAWRSPCSRETADALG